MILYNCVQALQQAITVKALTRQAPISPFNLFLTGLKPDTDVESVMTGNPAMFFSTAPGDAAALAKTAEHRHPIFDTQAGQRLKQGPLASQRLSRIQCGRQQAVRFCFFGQLQGGRGLLQGLGFLPVFGPGLLEDTFCTTRATDQ